MTAPTSPAAAVRTSAASPGPANAGRSAGTGVSTALPAPAFSRLARLGEHWLAFGVVIILALLLVPLPPVLLDALLALSIGLGLAVLMVTLSVGDPIEFSAFPSLLLLLTLLRLGLNVSTTRAILSTGYAGEVVEAFGGFLIGGNVVVGLVIFLVLIVINFMVITKGSGRIAEVAARFTLDAMPGKQMAIDADLGAGLIDESEARRRRQDVARNADFYGAMDGAAKFVRGDAMAGLVITAINLVGGFIIGMAQRGMSAGDAIAAYATLSVGDGLVSQIPALLVSTAGGIIVTYGNSGEGMGPTLSRQLTRYPKALAITGGLIGGIAFLPGLPALPFLLLGAGLGVVAWRGALAAEAALVSTTEAAPAPPASTQIRDLLAVDPLEIELGYALLPLVDEAQAGDLMQRIGIMRRQLAMDLGVIVPPARIRDNVQLAPTEYAIRLRGVRVAGGEAMPRYLLALDTGATLGPLEGIRTTDPTFGMPAVWITPERRLEAETAGYSVVETATVLSTHLMETVRRHAADLLSRQDVRELLDGVREHHPALVDDLVPTRLSLGALHRVLQRLLRERVAIRDLVTILEVLSDAADGSKDPELLTEQVRRGLASTIAVQFADADGTVRGITIGPRLEAALMQLFSPRVGREGVVPLSPDQLTGLLRSLDQLTNTAARDGRMRPLVVPPTLRVGIRRLIEPILPDVPVISLGELPPQRAVETLSLWEIADVA